LHFVAQGGIDLLMACNEAQALKLGGYHHGLPMTAIAVNGEVVASKASGNHGLNLFCSHWVRCLKNEINL
jgi:hypothetical protein